MPVIQGYLEAMATARREAIKDVSGYADSIIKHLIKVLLFDDEGAQHHWESEINAGLDNIATIKLKETNSAMDSATIMQGLKRTTFDDNPTMWVNREKRTYKNLPMYSTFDSGVKMQKAVYKILEDFAKLVEAEVYLQEGAEARIQDIKTYKAHLRKRKNRSYDEDILLFLTEAYKETAEVEKYADYKFSWDAKNNNLVAEFIESDTARHLTRSVKHIIDNLTLEIRLTKEAPNYDIYELEWWLYREIGKYYNQ